MLYVVRKHRVTGPTGEINRSVLIVNGERYHATKGYKTRAHWQ